MQPAATEVVISILLIADHDCRVEFRRARPLLQIMPRGSPGRRERNLAGNKPLEPRQPGEMNLRLRWQALWFATGNSIDVDPAHESSGDHKFRHRGIGNCSPVRLDVGAAFY